MRQHRHDKWDLRLSFAVFLAVIICFALHNTHLDAVFLNWGTDTSRRLFVQIFPPHPRRGYAHSQPMGKSWTRAHVFLPQPRLGNAHNQPTRNYVKQDPRRGDAVLASAGKTWWQATNLGASSPDKPLSRLQAGALNSEDANGRSQAELESFRYQTRFMKGPQAQASPGDAQKWTDMTVGFGYGIGVTLLLSIIYKFIVRGSHGAPLITMTPSDGAELQSSVSTAVPSIPSCAGLRAVGVFVSEGTPIPALKMVATRTRPLACLSGDAADRKPVAKKAKPAAFKAKAKAKLTPPRGWEPTYRLIEELRADRTAVVDSMGTEALAGMGTTKADLEYHALVSLMLSSQTRDTVNAATMVKLRAHGLTVESILRTDDDVLLELIKAVSFHNKKVRYIKETTAILAKEHGGRVPDEMDALLALPGVGPKMAIILLRVAFGKVVGISVDTHVHRIANQLGWVGVAPTKTPEKTRAVLEAWMPREVWPDVNLLLVGFGQEIQTEQPKLLRKALVCSDPIAARALLETCGMDVAKVERGLRKVVD